MVPWMGTASVDGGLACLYKLDFFQSAEWTKTTHIQS